MFGGKLEEIRNTLGEFIDGARKVETDRSWMLLDGQKLHRGADSSNLRPLGAIGVQVYRGTEAAEVLELNRRDNTPPPQHSRGQRLRERGIR